MYVVAQPINADGGAPSLTWCVDHLPDRHVFVGDEAIGPTVDFMVKLSELAGFSLSYGREASFADCLDSIKQGKYDLLAAINFSDERAKYMELIPMYDALPEQLFVKKNTRPAAHKRLTDISGVKLGVPAGYVINSSDFTLLTNHNTVEDIDGVEAGLAMLFYEHIDILIAPALSTSSLVQRNPRLSQSIEVSSVKLSISDQRQVHLGICKRCDRSAEVLPKIRQALYGMQQRNEIMPIMYPRINVEGLVYKE